MYIIYMIYYISNLVSRGHVRQACLAAVWQKNEMSESSEVDKLSISEGLKDVLLLPSLTRMN